MADEVRGRSKDTITKIIARFISNLKKKAVELKDSAKTRLDSSLQGMQRNSAVKEGAKRVAGDWKDGVERLSQTLTCEFWTPLEFWPASCFSRSIFASSSSQTYSIHDAAENGISPLIHHRNGIEILTKKLRNSNGGKPLPLYQVACCGFISGSTAALLWTPLESAVNKVGLTNLTYTNWLTTLRHTRLWRADTVALLTPRIAAYVGMLTSYDWSQTYFITKRGLRKLEAETYSSFVAGFFTAACSHPFLHAVAIANAVKTRKLAHSGIVPLIAFYLTPYSGSMFYTHFLTKFHYATGFCLVQYTIFERFGRLELIK